MNPEARISNQVSLDTVFHGEDIGNMGIGYDNGDDDDSTMAYVLSTKSHAIFLSYCLFLS